MAAKRGRPPIIIDWEQFDNLCQLQCTLEEISGFFKCSEDTIENKVKQEKGVIFSEYYKKASAGGKASLRRAMFKTALAGNVTAQIWLSKQHLGMSDHIVTNNFNHDKTKTIAELMNSPAKNRTVDDFDNE